jgi:O-antigen/teichoic acid export membrane protein
MMLTALLMAVFPKVSRGYAQAPRHYAASARMQVLAFAGALCAAGIVGVLLAPDYVQVLFARQYPRPVAATQVFMAALLLAGLDFVLGALLHASDRQHADTRAMLFGGLAQLTLLFVLVPRFGLAGAIAAKLAATAVQSGIKLALLQRAFPGVVRARDAARGALLLLVLGAATWPFVEANWPVRWMAALLLAGVALPALALVLGLVQPLRFLRATWKPRHATDAATFACLLDLVAADAREHARRPGSRRGRMDRRLAALLLYRVARFLHLAGWSRAAAALGRVARAATRLAIDPSSPRKPEWSAA